jgi:hypothetical protein
MNGLYPNLARLLVVRTRFLSDCDFLRRLVRLGDISVHPHGGPPGEEIEAVVARRYGIDWSALKAERAKVDTMGNGGADPEQVVAERSDFIRRTMEGHCLAVEVTATPLEETEWRAEAERRGMPVGDRERGWTDIVAGGARLGGAEPVQFLFCPDLIARSTSALPLLMPGQGKGELDLLLNVEGYLEILAHVLDVEVSLWETEPDPIRRRHSAEEALSADLGPATLRVLFAVQSTMLDAELGVRADLTGDDEWTDILDPGLDWGAT